MLKKFGRTRDNRPLVVLGLSEENMTRLREDQPIVVRLPEATLGLAGAKTGMPNCVIMIVGGRTEADIAAQVASSPVARLLADNPPTPGRTTIVLAEETP